MKRIFQSWPFFLGLFVGLYFFSISVTSSTLKYFPGDLGDSRFCMYMLENAHKFICFQTTTFWNAPFMYPETNVVTFSENLLGSVPFYSIFRFLGYDRETSFQFWFLLMYILNFTSCYFFLKWCFKNNYAAVLGAFVFAFSLALQSQMTHAQTFPRYPIPLAFWMCLFFYQNFDSRYFFLCLLSIVYQFYCSIYLGFLLSVPLSIMLVGIFIYKKEFFKVKLQDRKWLLLFPGSILVNLLVLAPLMLPYAVRSTQAGLNSYSSIVNSIPTLQSYFFSQKGSLLWNSLSELGVRYPAWWDHQIFAGAISTLSMLLFCILIFVRIKRRSLLNSNLIDIYAFFIFITCLITFILFTRYRSFSLYKIVYYFPGFGALRSITRIINIELLFYGFALAYIFNSFIKKQCSLFFVLILFFLVIDNYFIPTAIYRTEKEISQLQVNEIIQKSIGIPKSSLISYEPDSIIQACFVYQMNAMLASQSLNLKTINGYSGNSPIGYDRFWNKMDAASRQYWLNYKECKEKVFVIK